MEKEEVIKERLDHTGIFSFADFYSYAALWMKDNKYGVAEEKYSEKLSGNAKNISIEWKATKDVSDYFKNEIQIKIDGEKLVEVEAEIEGEKRKMDKGKILMEIKAITIRDPQGKWESTPFYRFLKDFYNRYIIPRRIFDTEEHLRNDVRSFKEDLKAFLELTGKRQMIGTRTAV